MLALTCDVLVAVEYNDVTIRRDVKVRPTTILHTLLDDKKPWVHIRLALMGADRSLFGCSCQVGEVLKSNAYMLIYEKNPAYTLETPFALGASGSDAPPLSM